MKRLRIKTYQNFYDDLMARITNTPLQLNEYMIKQAVLDAVRQLNEKVYYPRVVLFTNTGVEVDVSKYDIDSILNVFVSQETMKLNMILPEVGMLPLILGATGLTGTNLDNITDYLILKGNLNTMFRQLGYGVDYQLYQIPESEDNPKGKDILRFNQNYRYAVVSYLPFIDAEDEELSWKMWDREYQFTREYAWALINYRSAQSLFASSPLGVYKEAENLAKFWLEELNRLDKEFNDESVHFFVG
jgi:hypothetical protein